MSKKNLLTYLELEPNDAAITEGGVPQVGGPIKGRHLQE